MPTRKGACLRRARSGVNLHRCAAQLRDASTLSERVARDAADPRL